MVAGNVKGTSYSTLGNQFNWDPLTLDQRCGYLLWFKQSLGMLAATAAASGHPPAVVASWHRAWRVLHLFVLRATGPVVTSGAVGAEPKYEHVFREVNPKVQSGVVIVGPMSGGLAEAGAGLAKSVAAALARRVFGAGTVSLRIDLLTWAGLTVQEQARLAMAEAGTAMQWTLSDAGDSTADPSAPQRGPSGAVKRPPPKRGSPMWKLAAQALQIGLWVFLGYMFAVPVAEKAGQAINGLLANLFKGAGGIALAALIVGGLWMWSKSRNERGKVG